MTSLAVLNASLNISEFFSWVAQMPYSHSVRGEVIEVERC